MEVAIKGTKLKLTPQIKSYVQEKMNMLDKFLGRVQVINAEFEVELTTHHHVKGEIYRAEANIEVKGELLRVEKTEKDIFKAIDKVKDHMAMVITKYKSKRQRAKKIVK